MWNVTVDQKEGKYPNSTDDTVRLTYAGATTLQKKEAHVTWLCFLCHRGLTLLIGRLLTQSLTSLRPVPGVSSTLSLDLASLHYFLFLLLLNDIALFDFTSPLLHPLLAVATLCFVLLSRSLRRFLPILTFLVSVNPRHSG
jgi:hypothetical protein